jgi:membrane-associated phospholipid phosphatase
VEVRRERVWLTLAISASVFAALAAAVILSERANELDVRFGTWVHEHAPEWLVDAMRVVTHLGGAWVLVPLALLAVVLLVRRGRPRAALLVAAALALSQLLVQTLKFAIRRDRPELDDPFVVLTTYSFPSGHAFSTTATYGALALVLACKTADRARRIALYVAAAATVIVVAASRVILGVHYLLDVVAGIAGGIALLAALLLALGPREKRPQTRRYSASKKQKSA